MEFEPIKQEEFPNPDRLSDGRSAKWKERVNALKVGPQRIRVPDGRNPENLRCEVIATLKRTYGLSVETRIADGYLYVRLRQNGSAPHA